VLFCVYLWLNLQVRSSPRKFTAEQDLYAAALRALMRRAHSIHEMKEYLARRAEDKEAIAPVIARLCEQNFLDDAKFALDYARQHAQSRRQGRFRIARELRARGVPDRHIDAALDAVFFDTDEAALVRKRLGRHLARARAPLDQRKLASLYRSLLRAGFSSNLIRSELRAATRAEVPDSAAAPEDEA
jgi:regulatory protein